MSFGSEVRFAVASAADRALSLAMASTCAGCDREGTRLCRDCRGALERRLRVAPDGSTAHGSKVPAPLTRLEWCAPFTGITRRAIFRLGEAGERHLSGPLGEAIAHRWRTAGGNGDLLVPVPSSTTENQDRGFDEAVLLARVAGRRLHLPMIEALRRTSTDPAGPSSGDMFEVLEPARISGLSVVLVDGVVGTGERLGACARALLRAGAREVSAVTVARDGLAVSPSMALS